MPDGPHNAYLELYSDTGLLGVIALVVAAIFGVKLIRQIARAGRDNHIFGITIGIIAGLIAGGIHGIVDDNANVLVNIGNEYLYFAVPLLWLWAALLVVSSQRLLGNTDGLPQNYLGSENNSPP